MKKRHRLVFFCSLLFLIWSCQSDSRQMDWKQSPIEIQHFSYSNSSGTKDSIFNSQGIFIPTGTPFQSEVEKKTLIGFKGVLKTDAKKPSGSNVVVQDDYLIHWEVLPWDRQKMRTIRFGKGDPQFQQTNSTGGKVVTGEWISLTPKKLEMLTSSRKEARAQQLSQESRLSNVSTETGFEVNCVWSMEQDSMGDLWMGTRGSGLLKFDGNSFTQWDRKQGLPHNVIRSVALDQQGRVWMGTWGQGICMKEGDQFYQFSEAEGLSCNLITKIFIDSQQRIWFGTEYGGVGVIDHGRLMQYSAKEGLLENTILDIEESNTGEILFATYGAHLCSWDGQQFYYWDQAVGIKEQLIWCLNKDKEGTVWIGSYGESLYKWNGNTLSQLAIESNQKVGPVMSIRESKDGSIWMATYGKGIVQLQQDKINFIDAKDGLSNEKVLDVMVDRYNRIWASTVGNGIQVLNNASIKNFNIHSFLGTNAISTMVVTKDNAIIVGANGSGMVKWRDTSPMGLESFWDVGSAFYDAMEDHQGNIWIATDGYGLIKGSNDEAIKYNIQSGLCSNVVTAVFEDRKHRVWIAFDNNKVAYIQDETIFILPEYSAEARSAIRSFTEDEQGNIYWGVNDLGIVKCVLQESSLLIEIVAEQQGMPFRTFSDLTFWNGNLWLATEEGLVQWRNDQWSIVKHYLGRPLGQAFQLTPWKDRLMVWTEKGLLAFKIKMDASQNKIQDRPLEDFEIEKSDGLENERIPFSRDAKLGLDKNGDLVFACGREIFNIREQDWADSYSITTPTVSALLVNGVLAEWDLQSGQSGTNKLDDEAARWDFNHDQNNLSFIFSSGAESILSTSLYTYRLKGVQEEWSVPNSDRKIDFLGLPSGYYELQIAAVNANGSVSSIADYPFEIHPPWWFSVFAKVLYVIVLVLGIWFFIRWRTLRLKRNQMLLEREIASATQEIVQQKRQADEQREKIAESQKLMLESIEYAKRIQTAILPPQKLVRSYLPASFIIYQPKDIVAGDFYWMETLRHQNEDWIAFAAADCTGHGVPGALMSVLCHNGLNRSVKEHGLFYPNEILNKTREIVINELGDDDNVINDGMDISLCVLRQNKLYWSGANNPLWIVRNKEVIEYKGDKQPVGRFQKAFPFSLSEIILEKDDLIFIATDGFADQFGGPFGKKYKSLALKQLLMDNQKKDIQEIRKVLMRSFEIWKGKLEQVDDVCLIGFKY
jgi:serine phosphatase RsbU (regulator of sigma subunit)/ligand-binding sensor domain-containing protein